MSDTNAIDEAWESVAEILQDQASTRFTPEDESNPVTSGASRSFGVITENPIADLYRAEAPSYDNKGLAPVSDVMEHKLRKIVNEGFNGARKELKLELSQKESEIFQNWSNKTRADIADLLSLPANALAELKSTIQELRQQIKDNESPVRRSDK